MELNKTSLVTEVRIRRDRDKDFAVWQSKFHSELASSIGFVDAEIFRPEPLITSDWKIVQRFNSSENLLAWCDSLTRKQMLNEVAEMTPSKAFDIDVVEKITSDEAPSHRGVTEIFVTRVSPENSKKFMEWTGKMHEQQAKAKGFRRVFVQAPKSPDVESWITFLQFDTQENLDNWLESEERLAVLSDLKDCASSLESHRVMSSFAGWFASGSEENGFPPVWKQTMLILGVLYPVVMFELKLLSPYTSFMGLSFSTFIGNAISVALVSWPLMPLAIYGFYWWLYPNPKKGSSTLLGVLLIGLLYFLEVVFFALYTHLTQNNAHLG